MGKRKQLLKGDVGAETGKVGRPRKIQTSDQPVKVVKQNKPSEVLPGGEPDEFFKCVCCGHKFKKQEGKFPITKSPIFQGNNGYLPICRDCIVDLFNKYVSFFDNDEDLAAERMCQIIDMYFDMDAWNRTRRPTYNKDGTQKPRFLYYMSYINVALKGRPLTYEDYLIKLYEQAEEAERRQQDDEDSSYVDRADEPIEIPPLDSNLEGVIEQDVPAEETPLEVIRRFGTGFDAGDYDSLQYEYNNWVERYGEPIDKRQEELYISICYMKLNLQKLLQKGDANIGAAANNYKSQIEAATTEIEDRMRKAASERQISPLGEMIRDIEEFAPAEYYKDKKLFADFDHIKEYIDRFLTRPLRNLLTGSKELDKEFSLSDTEE